MLPRMVLPTELIEAVCFVLGRTLYQVLDGPLGVLLGPLAVQIDPSEVEVGGADALRCSALQEAQGSLEGLPLFGLRLVAKTAVIKIVNDVFGVGELGKFVPRLGKYHHFHTRPHRCLLQLLKQLDVLLFDPLLPLVRHFESRDLAHIILHGVLLLLRLAVVPG